MPIKFGKKKYKSFSSAVGAIRRKKGLSKSRASAYVAAVETAQGRDPRTHRRIRRVPTRRRSVSRRRVRRR